MKKDGSKITFLKFRHNYQILTDKNEQNQTLNRLKKVVDNAFYIVV